MSKFISNGPSAQIDLRFLNHSNMIVDKKRFRILENKNKSGEFHCLSIRIRWKQTNVILFLIFIFLNLKKENRLMQINCVG